MADSAQNKRSGRHDYLQVLWATVKGGRRNGDGEAEPQGFDLIREPNGRGASAQAVWLALFAHADVETLIGHPSLDTIARMTGLNPGTAWRHLERLGHVSPPGAGRRGRRGTRQSRRRG